MDLPLIHSSTSYARGFTSMLTYDYSLTYACLTSVQVKHRKYFTQIRSVIVWFLRTIPIILIEFTIQESDLGGNAAFMGFSRNFTLMCRVTNSLDFENNYLWESYIFYLKFGASVCACVCVRNRLPNQVLRWWNFYRWFIGSRVRSATEFND